MARIGIYGGTFNPPHIGHILAAQQCKSRLDLDRVILIPDAIPPHKQFDSDAPSPETRFHLTQLAVENMEGFSVSSIELQRQGTSYTVDTLRQLREDYPEDELFLLMGNDMFLTFHQWKDPEEIAKMATLVCMARLKSTPETEAELLNQAQMLHRQMKIDPILLHNDCVEVSSTEVRRLLFFGLADALVSPAVLARIREEHLYGVGAELCGLPYEQLKDISLRLHKSGRRVHAQGVSETAVQLAEHYGANLVDAARAGILHDITKALTPQQQLELCDRLQLPVSDFERANAKLLHAKTGAGVAEKIFGENEAVCTAIRYHTTGRAHMTILEKVIYIADYMEPGRCFDGVEKLREAVWRDLDEGVLLGIQMTVEQLKGRNQIVCDDSMEAERWLCGECKK